VTLGTLLLTVSFGGCQRPPAAPETETRSGALTGPQMFTIRLPNPVGLPSVAVAASDTLRVADRASTISPLTGAVSLVNTGTVQTDVGADTKLGTIISQSAIVIRDRSKVSGDAQSAGDISLINGATVSGTVKRLTAITPLQTFSWTVTFPAPGSAVSLEPDTSRTLSPGSYGDVSVKSRSTLRLNPGTYFVNSFSIEPQAIVAVDGGPVSLYVATTMNFKGTISAGAQDRSFLVGVAGTGTVLLESPFTGTIVAPNATIRFATVGGTGYTGSFFARGIDIQPDSVISLETFLGWETLFPLPEPRPTDLHPRVVCVTQQGGTSLALFGYFSDAFERQRVPLGPSNAFSPAPLGRGQIQEFLVGRHEPAFATPFTGSITWTLPGGSATANAQSPSCPTTTCTPACGAGETCLAGRCITHCGDGICAGEEGCDTCASDCACGTGNICYHNGCANPIRCGQEWQCGSGSAFGQTVDCGACPGGAACFNHVCQ
jgi:hypothetical protein